MPTGALIAENPLHAAAFLSIPPNSVVTHERFWPLPKPALDRQLPAAHALPRLEDAARGDPSRRPARDPDRAPRTTSRTGRSPEAGVWVIAETTDLPTKFAKIVVTDDRAAT